MCHIIKNWKMPKKFTVEQKHEIWQNLKRDKPALEVAESFDTAEKVIRNQFRKTLHLQKIYWSRAPKYPNAKYTWNVSSQKWLLNYAGVYITRCEKENEAAQLEDLIVDTLFPEQRKTHKWNIGKPSNADIKKFKSKYKVKIKAMKKRDKDYEWYKSRMKNIVKETILSEYEKGDSIPEHPTRIIHGRTDEGANEKNSSPEEGSESESVSEEQSESESEEDESESDSEESEAASDSEPDPPQKKRTQSTKSKSRVRTSSNGISWANLPSDIVSSTSVDSLSSNVQRSLSPNSDRASKSANSSDDIIRAIGAERFASSANSVVSTSVVATSRKEQVKDLIELIRREQEAKAGSSASSMVANTSRKSVPRKRSRPQIAPPPRKKNKPNIPVPPRRQKSKPLEMQLNRNRVVVDLTSPESEKKRFWCENWDIQERKGKTVVWFDKRTHHYNMFDERDQLPVLEEVSCKIEEKKVHRR